MYPVVELLDHIVNLFLIWGWNCHTILQLPHLTFPPEMQVGSSFPEKAFVIRRHPSSRELNVVREEETRRSRDRAFRARSSSAEVGRVVGMSLYSRGQRWGSRGEGGGLDGFCRTWLRPQTCSSLLSCPPCCSHSPCTLSTSDPKPPLWWSPFPGSCLGFSGSVLSLFSPYSPDHPLWPRLHVRR